MERHTRGRAKGCPWQKNARRPLSDQARQQVRSGDDSRRGTGRGQVVADLRSKRPHVTARVRRAGQRIQERRTKISLFFALASSAADSVAEGGREGWPGRSGFAEAPDVWRCVPPKSAPQARRLENRPPLCSK